ncbi:hypothetical protein V9T40_009849 [Parthenolecanium corni]|uniref:Uncharacterized protein n=1 Tax=Parthenolecanium corni TaxID=536013 RepID=A0AAN9Y6A8_9HEMI
MGPRVRSQRPALAHPIFKYRASRRDDEPWQKFDSCRSFDRRWLLELDSTPRTFTRWNRLRMECGSTATEKVGESELDGDEEVRGVKRLEFLRGYRRRANHPTYYFIFVSTFQFATPLPVPADLDRRSDFDLRAPSARRIILATTATRFDSYFMSCIPLVVWTNTVVHAYNVVVEREPCHVVRRDERTARMQQNTFSVCLVDRYIDSKVRLAKFCFGFSTSHRPVTTDVAFLCDRITPSECRFDVGCRCSWRSSANCQLPTANGQRLRTMRRDCDCSRLFETKLADIGIFPDWYSLSYLFVIELN